MNAAIKAEDEDGCAVEVTDNNGVVHWIEIAYDTGEITYHEQGGYPDEVAKRTDSENEHTAQARRYARYYAGRERGYQLREPYETPESIAVVAATIASLSSAEFEDHFGDYYRQFRSTAEPDIEPIVDHPDSAGLTVYRVNVHLDTDLVDRHLSAIEESLSGETEPTAVAERIVDSGIGAVSISSVSDLGVLYQTEQGETEHGPEDQNERKPAARLELSPIDAPWEEYLTVEGFQILVVHHLLCQIRDCYLEMGLEPPAAVRVLGMGAYRQTIRNEHRDMYDPVHYTDSPVEGYRLPEFGTHLES